MAIWEQIRDTLRAEITEGTFAAGDRLPTEAALAQRFDVNRHTVRRALSDMAEAGLVNARRGAGVFVTGVHLSYPIGGRARFSQNIAESGHRSRRQILRMETRPATAAQARDLGLAKGAPVHLAETVSEANDIPIAHGHSTFPAEGLDALPEVLRETGSITKALAACGINDYRRKVTRLVAERAGTLIARHLRIAEGAPVLVSRGVNIDTSGRPVEYARTWFASERLELVIGEDD